MTDISGLMPVKHFQFAVVGGGIAGTTCAETLSTLCPSESILLLSASAIIKTVVNFKQVSQTLHTFQVEERSSSELSSRCSNITVLNDVVVKFNENSKEIITKSGSRYQFTKLCICTGGRPKVISKDNPFVLGIRDTETILNFEKKLANARRVVVVGNGGIATELVYRISNCEVIWAIKDKSIVSTFIDAGAAKFFVPQLGVGATLHTGPSKRTKYQLDAAGETSSSVSLPPSIGAALGPDWINVLPVCSVAGASSRAVQVEYEVEVSEILSSELWRSKQTSLEEDHPESRGSWPVFVKLTNGKVFGCDFIVSATGVDPNVWPFVDDCAKFEVAEDGGLKVNARMQTAVPDVYAAGDVCHATWKHSEFWLQMRLWSQARLMGYHAAHCMASAADCNGDDVLEQPTEFGFELFAHMTKFFGYKVVLLGRFNGQGLGNDHKLLIRVQEGEQYVKAVMHNGRMVGAVLIGETDLEETFENLILNQLDLSVYGDELLDQDIEDFFD